MNITGRLTRNAQVTTTPTGREVVNFSIAVNESYKAKDGQRIEQTAYFDCAYWRTAKAASWLQKGLLVELTGQISVRAWLDKEDGKPKAGLNFHTTTIKPLAKSGKNDTNSVQDSIEPNNNKKGKGKDDLPF
ncbi:single-stranded DNA-binding protein [Sphingobacterium sp. SRCM116780]|uniref:single-stranded DNA-binding protein n=1 Tax=Sphingobacterium sp. SRCM116780 TaxID=2907623 RepID=UPI001F169A3B|nr:single-stranded DNA-binding protein [Sphingobacterium sp. SRCM116780]UIR57798.1 single-stranded DNA-binding protein [Sphingobacterium sp. SRCM116780]